MKHVPRARHRQYLHVGTVDSVQYFLFEIMKVDIKGEIRRVITCAPQ